MHCHDKLFVYVTYRFVTHHNESRVASVSFSYGPRDGSPMRIRVESASPVFVDLGQVGVAAAAAELIASYDIDVLVDLTVLTYNSRLDIPAHKPAPIVINYLGFPGPAGCKSFDYALVDPISAPPEIQGSFNERLLFMPPGIGTNEGGGGGVSVDHSLFRVYQGNDMPLHVPLSCGNCGSEVVSGEVAALCDRKTCRQRLLAAELNDSKWSGKGVLTRIGPQESKYTILCSFNANKKLEPISFQGMQ